MVCLVKKLFTDTWALPRVELTGVISISGRPVGFSSYLTVEAVALLLSDSRTCAKTGKKMLLVKSLLRSLTNVSADVTKLPQMLRTENLSYELPSSAKC